MSATPIRCEFCGRTDTGPFFKVEKPSDLAELVMCTTCVATFDVPTAVEDARRARKAKPR